MIFSLRQFQEKAIEQDHKLFMVFVNFRKAFDTVNRSMYWKFLKLFWCPEFLIDIVRKFHEGMKGRVNVGTLLSEELEVNHGTKQGCVLASTFYTLFLTAVLLVLWEETHEGVFVGTRSDGKLFNLARLKAKTRTRRELIRGLLFADDTDLVAHKQAHIQ